MKLHATTKLTLLNLLTLAPACGFEGNSSFGLGRGAPQQGQVVFFPLQGSLVDLTNSEQDTLFELEGSASEEEDFDDIFIETPLDENGRPIGPGVVVQLHPNG
jgi:hypothetical protein